MTLIDKINNTDIRQECVKCKGKTEFAGWEISDWKCLKCETLQLAYVKSLGFRYYAFLLEGSWTSDYIKAQTLKQAYKRAVKKYNGTKIMGQETKVLQSYLVGGVDQFVLRDWQGFNFN